ncbi:MAG: hypothetical protein ABJA82_09990 [Myxococcales bacterium]
MRRAGFFQGRLRKKFVWNLSAVPLSGQDKEITMEAFHSGGWGMYPTLVFGVLMIGASVAYALRPERRFIPVQISLGIMTLVAGSLGFVTGLIKSLGAIHQVPEDQRFIWLIGLGESLNNVALALTLVVFAALAISVGAVRVAFGRPRAA